MISYFNLYSNLKLKRTFSILTILTTLSLVSYTSPTTPSTQVEPSTFETEVSSQVNSPTLENLQKAYNGEYNAHKLTIKSL